VVLAISGALGGLNPALLTLGAVAVATAAGVRLGRPANVLNAAVAPPH
jgi:hypothetical protein